MKNHSPREFQTYGETFMWTVVPLDRCSHTNTHAYLHKETADFRRTLLVKMTCPHGNVRYRLVRMTSVEYMAYKIKKQFL